MDFSHLKVTSAGGMALQTSVAERWAKLTGNTPCEGYGPNRNLTCSLFKSDDGTTVRVGTIGLPWPSTEMKTIRDDGTDTPIGEAGEIVARGPQVFKGYYNRPEETAKAMLEDWFKTGDVGVMNEDGFFQNR